MKFLCGNCKAKYQIADEKVTGRTLRMKCRRCDHDILIDGHSMPSPPPGQPMPGPVVPGQTGSARRGGVSVVPGPGRSGGSGAHPMPPRVPGGIPAPPQRPGARSKPPSGLNAEFRRHVAAPPEVPQRTSPYDQWHVAIQDVPVGPMTRDELGRKVESGAVNADSLCWREGMDDWRPLGELPELTALLRRAPRGSQRPSRSRAPVAPPLGHEPDEFDDDTNEPTRIADLTGPNSPLAASVAAASARGVAGAASSPRIVVPAAAAAPVQPVQAVEAQAPANKGGGNGLTTGIAVGLLVGILLVGGPMLYRNTWGSPAPVAQTPVATAPTQQDVDRAAQDIVAVVPEQPAEVEVVEEAPKTETKTPTTSTGTKTTTSSTATKTTTTTQPKDGLTDEQRKLLERMGAGGETEIPKVGTGSKTSSSSASSGPALTATQLSAVVQSNKTVLQRCYETALRAAGGRQDGTIKVTVNVTVGGSGTVKSVTTQGTGLGDMNECLKKSVKTWRFPTSGGDSEFAFPLVFQPGG